MKNNKQTYLEVRFLHKCVLEDVFNEGCIPGTDWDGFIMINLIADTQEELIDKLCNQLGIPNIKENYIINSCYEVGRIDFIILENSEGHPAYSEEIEIWEKGKLKLYNCIYTVYVIQVHKTMFNLKEGVTK